MKKATLFLILALIGYASEAQTLVAKWTFDNGGATDVSGNGLNGIVSNTTAVAGKSGTPNTALQFNGTSSKVDVPYHSSMNLNQFTIVAMVKPMGFNANTCQGSYIIARGDANYSSTHPYNLHMTDNPYDLSCLTYSPNHTNFVSNVAGTYGWSASQWNITPTINLNQWYCVVATHDGSNVKLYIDGVLKLTLPYTPDPTTSTAPISIGYNANNSSYPYYFNGIIDEIQLWNGVLTPQAIIAQCTPGPIECELKDVAWGATAKTPLKYTFMPDVTPSVPVTWNFGDGNTGISQPGQPITHTYSSDGNYTVCAVPMDGDSTCGDTLCFDLCAGNGATIIKGGGNTPDKAIGDPYPNPANTTLYIPVRTARGEVSISIMSIDGKTMQTKKQSTGKGDQNVELSISDLPGGIYMVEIIEDGARRVKRVSKL